MRSMPTLRKTRSRLHRGHGGVRARRVMLVDEPSRDVEPEVVPELPAQVQTVVPHLVAEVGHDEPQPRELRKHGPPVERHAVLFAIRDSRGAVREDRQLRLLQPLVDRHHVRVIRHVLADAGVHLDALRAVRDAAIQLLACRRAEEHGVDHDEGDDPGLVRVRLAGPVVEAAHALAHALGEIEADPLDLLVVRSAGADAHETRLDHAAGVDDVLGGDVADPALVHVRDHGGRVAPVPLVRPARLGEDQPFLVHVPAEMQMDVDDLGTVRGCRHVAPPSSGRPAARAGCPSYDAGLNRGTTTSGATPSNTTSTGIPTSIASLSTSTRLLIRRTPSSSSMIATL